MAYTADQVQLVKDLVAIYQFSEPSKEICEAYLDWHYSNPPEGVHCRSKEAKLKQLMGL